MAGRPPLPPWIRVRIGAGDGRRQVDEILARHKLNTVCRGAECPNLCECWQNRVATFMIMGDSCTRDCRFCAVPHDPAPPPPDPREPASVAAAAKELGLRHVVVTSVTRDDLPDGGASVFAATVAAIRSAIPAATVEVLTPDFQGSMDSLAVILAAAPDVFNHNLETVERLSVKIRSKANYKRSLKMLAGAVRLSKGDIPVKSGFMLGLGETRAEIGEAIRDLRGAGVAMLTIGQYLPPSGGHWPLERYATPEEFSEWEAFAREIGFEKVASSPLVRSSYHAADFL